mmetsp:Transcript_21600/g.40342  ORF Transcript_21600/g.40342 Transcript_21600/m.40342 type:complete len:223 (+) Transcript_21600:1666-2334(+)
MRGFDPSSSGSDGRALAVEAQPVRGYNGPYAGQTESKIEAVAEPVPRRGFFGRYKFLILGVALFATALMVGLFLPKQVEIEAVVIDNALNNVEVEENFQIVTSLITDVQNNNFLEVDVILLEATMEYEGVYIGNITLLGEVGTLQARSVSPLQVKVDPDISVVLANGFDLIGQVFQDCFAEDAKGTMSLLIQGLATGSVLGGSLEVAQPLNQTLEFPCIISS